MAASVRLNKLKEPVQVKNKNLLRQQLTAFVCVCVCVKTKRTIAGNVFSDSGAEIMRTYPIRKHLWNIIQSFKCIFNLYQAHLETCWKEKGCL